MKWLACWLGRFDLIFFAGGFQQWIEVARAVRVLDNLNHGGIERYLLHVDMSADDIHQTAAGADLFDDDQWFGVISGRQPQVFKGDRGKRTDARIANGDRGVDRRAEARQNECLQKECAGQEEIKQHQQQQAAAADPKQKAEPTWLRLFRLRRCPLVGHSVP